MAKVNENELGDDFSYILRLATLISMVFDRLHRDLLRLMELDSDRPVRFAAWRKSMETNSAVI